LSIKLKTTYHKCFSKIFFAVGYKGLKIAHPPYLGNPVYIFGKVSKNPVTSIDN
jgi:hypothetical protein